MSRTVDLSNEKYNKLQHLLSLGVVVDEYDEDDVYYTADCYSRIPWDEFEVGEPLHVIINRSDLISCCGETMDKDELMCPICKEHN